MEIGKVYGMVLVLGMVGILIAIVLTVLDKLQGTMTVKNSDNKAWLGVNKTITAIYDIPNSWLGVLVVIGIAGVILYAVVRFGGSAGGKGRRR